ncbi:helix-turn-helix domain-containing protein [Halalkalicoccus sp. NIPERK01]|uniref:helix-turn-helix domain-containing protein n=1 Tax=Halalkalicoccus sp. NIPERK01 TaxID=3053469 RepID=UPI00256EA27E|nr:helix-turn-helix domain-containing protein [Halalkalicoccus sp. NIPERK01]MDL5362871.1 helix-turn-helix domain-containing protein [Halalkalicoccus sp. NIPERK01]
MAESDADFHDLVLMDEPGFEHVMGCVFGIQDHECRAYVELLDVPGSTVAELAEDLERDRSNVNRSLATLREKGLIERERRLLDSGGYVYQHTAVPLPEAKARMHEALEEWSERVHGRIDEFGSPA